MEKILQKYSWLLALLAGLTLIALGFLSWRGVFERPEPEVEIIGSNEKEVIRGEMTSKIMVEIAGEVVKPGVYELMAGSRVNDLLTVAGGLAEGADRSWVSRNLNLAQKLVDGAKIFIPSRETNLSNLPNLPSPQVLSNKINLNTASVAELDSLWGIGEATAQKIIAGRPYQRPEELLEKKIVKSNVWEAIKDQVTVF